MKRNAENGTTNIAQKFGYKSARELVFSCNDTAIYLAGEVCRVYDRSFPSGTISYRVWYYF